MLAKNGTGCRVIEAAGLRVPARNALLADVVPASAYGRAYGFERAMDNLGAIGGPLLALGLVARVDVRAAMLLSIIPGLLATVAILYAIRHAPRPERHGRQPIRLRIRPVLRGELGRLLGAVAAFEVAPRPSGSPSPARTSSRWPCPSWPPAWPSAASRQPNTPPSPPWLRPTYAVQRSASSPPCRRSATSPQQRRRPAVDSRLTRGGVRVPGRVDAARSWRLVVAARSNRPGS
jgi:hypothetical protein